MIASPHDPEDCADPKCGRLIDAMCDTCSEPKDECTCGVQSAADLDMEERMRNDY